MSKSGKHRGRFGYGRNSTDDEPGAERDFIFVRETDLAWGVTDCPLTGATVWLPKSACSYVSNTRGELPVLPGLCITLWVPDWLAEQEGLA